MKRAAIVALVAIACLVACRGRPAREDCDAAMDHYVDLAIAEDPGLAKLKGAELKAARDMKRELRLGQPAFRKVHDRCVTEVTKSELSCAEDAKSTQEWEACVAK
jgi:hypothetical protein